MFQHLFLSPGKVIQAGRNFLLRAVGTFLTQNGAVSVARILMLAGVCGLLLSAAFAHGTPKAFANPAAPWHSDSYYVTSTSTSTAYSHGESQGAADASHGSNSLVVLDFGGQVNTSTVDNWDAGNISNGTVEAVAEAFAHGYIAGGNGSTILELAIGTNNSDDPGSSSTGSAWANVAATVQSYDQSHGYASQVVAMGGNDIEPDWGGLNSWAPGEAWASGYSGAGSGTLYLDFGSADGCLTNSSNDAACNNGWHQYGLWDVSWGSSAAVPAPQIYSDTLAWQWQKISLYGYEYQGGRAIGFWGSMATPAYITPANAWYDFWNALNSDSRTATGLPYNTSIAWTW
jgi:hypothetical protein